MPQKGLWGTSDNHVMLPTALVRFVMGKILGQAIEVLRYQKILGWSLYLTHSLSCEKRNINALIGIQTEHYHFHSFLFPYFSTRCQCGPFFIKILRLERGRRVSYLQSLVIIWESQLWHNYFQTASRFELMKMKKGCGKSVTQPVLLKKKKKKNLRLSDT